MQNLWFSTGDFAKLNKVSKRTLFYYAEEGIFRPEKIDDNGYHYYSKQQLHEFYLIRSLRKIGVSIHELKEYLSFKSPDRLMALLEPKQQQMEKDLQHKVRLNIFLKNKIQLLNESLNVQTNKITIQYLPSMPMFISDPLKGDKGGDDRQHYLEHAQICLDNNLGIGYPIGAMLSKESMQNGEFTSYSYYFTHTSNTYFSQNYMHAHEFLRPAGYYAVCYANGAHELSPTVYPNLLKFIKDHHFEIDDFSYENALFDSLCTNCVQEHLACLMIKLKK